MSRTLLITNDFPPRPGGIQSFVHNLAVRQQPGSVVVYASSWRGAEKFDADQRFEVVRERTRVLLPTPLIARRAARLARAYDCDTVWFGAAAPLGLLAAPAYFVGILAGWAMFSRGGEWLYRMVTFALVVMAALLALPVFDSVFDAIARQLAG